MGTTNINIRRLTLQDMAQAAIIHRTTFDDHLPWLKGLHSPEEDRWFYENHIFPQCEVWAGLQPEPVGIIAFKEGWIEQLYVLPAFQGQGIGSALLQKTQNSFTQLKLWTFQRNETAKQFYEKYGFQAIEHTDGQRNEEKEPDVLYQWQRHAEVIQIIAT